MGCSKPIHEEKFDMAKYIFLQYVDESRAPRPGAPDPVAVVGAGQPAAAQRPCQVRAGRCASGKWKSILSPMLPARAQNLRRSRAWLGACVAASTLVLAACGSTPGGASASPSAVTTPSVPANPNALIHSDGFIALDGQGNTYVDRKSVV